MSIEQKKYPFKFLNYYTNTDRDIFFGRKEETDLIYEMIFQTNVVIVFGEMGTGKTSIIRCGLSTKFETFSWHPIYIRRGTNFNASLRATLQSELGSSLDKDKSHNPNEFLEAIYLKYYRPVYLIFDQFEEIYVSGTVKEQIDLIKTVKEILNLKTFVKLIIIIREEFLGHLYEFEKRVPQLLKKKIRIESMDFDKVSEVLKNISAHPNSLFRLEQKQEDTIVNGIFERIKGKSKTLSIQPTHLQLYMDRLYKEISGDETEKTEVICSANDLKIMQDIDDVLQDFLDSQVSKISKEMEGTLIDSSESKIWSILSNFVTLEGTKKPVTIGTLSKSLKGTDDPGTKKILRSFTDSRILKPLDASQLPSSEEEAQAKDGQTYELTHDSLAKRIAEKRSTEETALLEIQRMVKNQLNLNDSTREPLSEKQLNRLEPWINEDNFSSDELEFINESKNTARLKKEDEAKRKKILTIYSWVITVVSLLLICAIYFLVEMYNNSETISEQNRLYADSVSIQSIKLKKALQENARIRYESDSTSYYNQYQLATELYNQSKHSDALRVDTLAINIVSRYSRVAQSDTLDTPKTIDNHAQRAEELKQKIQAQVPLEQIISEVRKALEKGKKSETEGTLELPLKYRDARVSYAEAERKIRMAKNSIEYEKLNQEVAERQRDIMVKLEAATNKLMDDISIFIKESEGHAVARQKLEIVKLITPTPNDKRIAFYEGILY